MDHEVIVDVEVSQPAAQVPQHRQPLCGMWQIRDRTGNRKQSRRLGKEHRAGSKKAVGDWVGRTE